MHKQQNCSIIYVVNNTKKQIITIAGQPGSGKSTTAKGLANQLGYNHFSSGDLFRMVSKEQGHDVLQANLAAETESGIPVIDQIVDQRLRDMGEQQTHLVIDSRLAWHWVPEAFKVFLNLNLTVAAQRILRDMTPERVQAEHIPTNPTHYAQLLQERLDSESRRYKKIYQADPYDLTNYDLIVDTQTNGVEAVINIILKEYDNWNNS